MSEEQWESDFMPLAELLARTGLTRIQLTNDIKNGLFPGKIVRRQPRVVRRHYERWIEGDLPLEVRRPTQSFLRQVNSADFLRHGEEVE